MSTSNRSSPNSPNTVPTTPTSPQSGPALRAVRRNGLETLRRSLAETSRASRIILGVNLFTIVAQVTITGIVLGFTAHQSCDWRVRFYLIAYVVRCILLAPVVVHQNLRPSTRPNRGVNNNNSSNNNSPPSALEEGRPVPSSPGHTNATSQGVEAASERATLMTSEINRKVDRAKSFLDFAGTFLFVIGNFILFDKKPEMCAHNAPALYYLMVTWIILDYIVILIPVILCGAIIFCLPWVLVIMRVFRIGQAGGMGAEETEIQKLPTVIYRARRLSAQPGTLPTPTSAGASDSADSLSPSEDDTGDAAPLHRPKERWWKSWRVFRRLRKTKKSTTGVSPGDSLKENELMLEDDDAVCVICLVEYEDGVELRKLLCGHHFHTGCVDEWLRINRSCPLCKRDINVDPNATEQNESNPNPNTPLIDQAPSPPLMGPTVTGEGVGSSPSTPFAVVPFAQENSDREILMHGGFSPTNVWNTTSDTRHDNVRS